MRSIEEIEQDIEIMMIFGLQGSTIEEVMDLEEELRQAKKEQRREQQGVLHVIADTEDHVPVDKEDIREALKEVNNG